MPRKRDGLGNYVEEILRRDEALPLIDMSSALDFVEGTHGLGVKLRPLQRLIFKCILGIPVDYREEMVPMWNPLKTELIRTVPESECLKILADENRCNVSDWRDIPPQGFGTSLVLAGRRAGKSQLVSALAAVQLRNLLNIPDPQDYYGLVRGSTITFTFIGTDEDSSTRLYEKVRADVNRSPFFQPYLFMSPNTTDMSFFTQADKERKNLIPSIEVAAFACTTRAVRGPSSYFLALDEFAHFRSSKNSNSEELYLASTPSTSQFPSRDDPNRTDAKVIMISSPLGRLGKMFELSQQALQQGVRSDIFMMQVSTAEMNPVIPAKTLKKDYDTNPETFAAEFGGEFLDGSGSYVPPEKFRICVSNRQNMQRFDVSSIGKKYFWGLDYGTKKDATGLAISHLEIQEGRGVVLVFDYIDRMMVGEKFEGPGVTNPEVIMTLKELQVMDVISWLKKMHEFLPCHAGMIDQYGGTTLKQLLNINEIPNIELVHITADINSKMYFALKGFIDNGCAEFPEVPKFEREFQQLEASYRSKYVLAVSAPEEKGAHDDMADAAASSAWLAQQWLETEGKLDKDPSGSSMRTNYRAGAPPVVINPNDVSVSDLKSLDRQGTMGVGDMLPPGFVEARNPFLYRGGRRR